MISMRGLLAVAVLSLSACASPPVGQDPDVTFLETQTLPVPSDVVVSQGQIGGGLAPGDLIEMTVYGAEDLAGSSVVGASGVVEFPFTGPIQAAGITQAELRSIIADRLSPQVVVDPQVTLVVTPGPGRQVTVGGQVSQPGFYPTGNATSLLRAVTAAGWINDEASRSEVIIIRETDGERYLGLYDLEAIQRGNYDDPDIYPGDIVMVGDNRFLRRLQIMANLVTLVTQPLIAVDRVSN